MAERRCPCGADLTGRHPSAKTCSPRCKKRTQRGTVVELPPQAESSVVGAVTTAVRTELSAVERHQTSAGQAALALAERIDSRADTGSALAALVKELRSTVEVALAGTAAVVSPLDELRLRREQRRGA